MNEEHNYFQRVIDEEIDLQMALQKKAYSIQKIMDTMHNLGLFDGLRSTGIHRIESDEEWIDMGCPSAQYYFRAHIELAPGSEATYYEILI